MGMVLYVKQQQMDVPTLCHNSVSITIPDMANTSSGNINSNNNNNNNNNKPDVKGLLHRDLSQTTENLCCTAHLPFSTLRKYFVFFPQKSYVCYISHES